MSDPFCCVPLRSDDNNKEIIKTFEIYREADYEELFPDKIVGLKQYLQECAWEDDENDLVRIYLILDTDSHEAVAYFGLKAGLIASNMEEALIAEEQQRVYNENSAKLFPEVVPGIEISHFAVNDRYRDKMLDDEGSPVRGLGRYLFPKYVYPIIREVGTKIGVHLVYLYAAGDEPLTHYYEEAFGFHEMTDEDEMAEAIADIMDTCDVTGNEHLRWFRNLLGRHFSGIIAHAVYHILSGKVERNKPKD